MKFTLLRCLVLLLIAGSAVAADNWPGEGGKSDVVKGWPAMDFQVALQTGKPVMAFIFDPDTKQNPRSKYLEGRDALANIDVRDALKDFQCLRIKADGTDVRGWPKDMLFNSQRSASIVMLSSDGKKVFTFDKRMSNEQIKPSVLVSTAVGITKYEESIKTQKDTQDKLAGTSKKDDKKETAAAEPVNNKVPGLPPREEGVPGLKKEEKVEAKPAPAPTKKAPQPTDE